MNKILACGAAASALLFSGTALAGTAQPASVDAPVQHGHHAQPMTRAAVEARAAKSFARLDLNKDGEISLAEMQQAALARFDRADINHDGTISPDERQQAHHARRHRNG